MMDKSESFVSRTEIETTGSYVAVPDAFPTAEEAVRNALKLEFRTIYSPERLIESVFSTDKLLIDFEAVDPEGFDPRVVAADCDLLKEVVQRYPDEVRHLLLALRRGGAEGAEEARRLAEHIGLTEEAAQRRGGGFFWIVVVIGGGLLGCGGGKASKAAKAKTTPSKVLPGGGSGSGGQPQ